MDTYVDILLIAFVVGIVMFSLQMFLCASKMRWIVKLLPSMASFVLLVLSALAFIITIGATDRMHITGGVLLSVVMAFVMALLAWILFGVVYVIKKLIKKVCRCK